MTRRAIDTASVAALCFAAAASWAAPVVVQKGSTAQYIYIPADSVGSGGGVGGMQTLQTCFVEFSRGDRTVILSTRNWFTQTTPITVYYKMIGGGAGIATLVGSGAKYAQFQSAGGSSAIVKNNTVLVAAAAGMDGNHGGVFNAPTPGSLVSGQFALSKADTLRIVVGGGAGSGMVASQYTGVWEYSGVPGGGGSGWGGGGAGANLAWTTTLPSPAAGAATGGTGTAGGAGTPAGGGGYGGTNTGAGGAASGGGGGSAASDGASNGANLWNGYTSMDYTLGAGGGGYGHYGRSSGDNNGGFSCPGNGPDQTYTPNKPTGFSLHPAAGESGYYFYYTDPASNPHSCYAGGGRGQVVMQYQAPTCDLIPNWDEN